MKQKIFIISLLLLIIPMSTFASEADLTIPELGEGRKLLYWGFIITFLGMLFGLYHFLKVRKIRAHQSMLDVAQVIYGTCKTYLIDE